jgi:hypothetical protein
MIKKFLKKILDKNDQFLENKAEKDDPGSFQG